MRHIPVRLIRAMAVFLAVMAAVAALAAVAAPTAPAEAATVPPGAAAGLPAGFSLVVGPAGAELVWSGAKVPIGGARPEFRLADDVIGYPREVAGQLHLTLSADEQARILAAPSDLEVWSSGRRLDRPATARAGRAALAPVAGYDSAPPVTPTVPVDPAAAGPYRTQRLTYSLAPFAFADYPAPFEVQAEVTQPLQAPGKRPLVLILHGRHATCFRGGPNGEANGDWPCPAGWSPIPSYQGYRYVADALASQGYMVVSIAANGINGQDFAFADAGTAARSALIRHHLDLWATWNDRGGDPWGGRFKQKVDLKQVVLVGHSRGGEGVNRAAIDASGDDPYKIVGIVSYGPTAFGHQVTPDVHSVTLLPSCDGDVSDLQGQNYIDASRDVAPSETLRSAVTALGANHNFFNTEWTPGLAQAPSFDDWFDPADPTCGDASTLRLTPAEEQKVGAAYTAALVHLAVDRDPKMLPLLDGSFVKPAAIGRAEVGVSAVGGPATLLYRPESAGVPVLAGGMTGQECQGYLPLLAPPVPPACGGGDGFQGQVAPHWQFQIRLGTRPAPQAMELTWTAAGAAAQFTTPGRGAELGDYDSIDVRVANDPNRPPAGLDLRIRDSNGRTAILPTNLQSIDGWPGIDQPDFPQLDRVQARTLRGDLRSVSQIDRGKIVSVDLVTRTANGRVWVLDVAATKARIAKPEVLDLPLVSVSSIKVPEGDTFGQAEVTISVERRLERAGTVWMQSNVAAPDGSRVIQGRALNLPAGARSVVATVPVSWLGDDLYSQVVVGQTPLNGGRVTLGAVSNVLTGNYIGGATTIEDEPTPTLSAVATQVTGAEGQSLRWTLKLSGPTTGAFYGFVARPPVGPELDTADVDPDWLAGWLFPLPTSPVPLSQAAGFLGQGLGLFVQFDPGATEAVLDVPIRADGLAEPAESARFDLTELFGPDPTFPAGGLTLTGTVAAG